MNYLSTLFDEGLQYRTVNAHWSAISAYHNFINGKPIGKHPKVCAILTGIFNKRPPQPRYTFISDVDVVLTYIKNNMFVNSQLSEKNYVRAQSACNIFPILSIKLEEDLILPTLPQPLQ